MLEVNHQSIACSFYGRHIFATSGKACARVQRELYKEWDEEPLNSATEGAQSINDMEEEGSGCSGIGDVHASMAAVWGSCRQRRQSQGAKGNAEREWTLELPCLLPLQ
ncbi:hypothetical protein L7F22_001338 [Adiantum nelumboides]|nr:hypothetical protein [Adiantum nelumboides]